MIPSFYDERLEAMLSEGKSMKLHCDCGRAVKARAHRTLAADTVDDIRGYLDALSQAGTSGIIEIRPNGDGYLIDVDENLHIPKGRRVVNIK